MTEIHRTGRGVPSLDLRLPPEASACAEVVVEETVQRSANGLQRLSRGPAEWFRMVEVGVTLCASAGGGLSRRRPAGGPGHGAGGRASWQQLRALAVAQAAQRQRVADELLETSPHLLPEDRAFARTLAHNRQTNWRRHAGQQVAAGVWVH